MSPDVPDWQETTVGAVASVSRGASPRPIASVRWFDVKSDVRWVRIADVNRSDGRTLRATTQAISADGIVRSRYLKPGTLIMSIAATVGIPVITGVPTCIHDGFVALENLQVDKRFLLYLLKASEQKLREAGQSGSQINVNSDIVRELTIHIPPDRREQDRIASMLWDVDELIASLELLIAKKQAIKQGMMQQLLTGRTRLPGFDDEWSDTKLGQVLRFQVGFPFSSRFFSSTPVGPRLVRNRDLRAGDAKIYFAGWASAEYALSAGDILVGMDGDFEPVTWHEPGALLNQRVGRLRLSERVSGPFLSYALIAPLKALENATGATTVKHLSHRDLEGLSMGLPGRDEQDAIAIALADVDAEIDMLRVRLRKTHTLKTGMMQQLLTGRTRLPVAGAS